MMDISYFWKSSFFEQRWSMHHDFPIGTIFCVLYDCVRDYTVVFSETDLGAISGMVAY